MATAPLWLVSASPASPSHLDKVSLTVAVATYCCPACLTPWCPSPCFYLHVISLAANDHMRTSYMHVSAFCCSGIEGQNADAHAHKPTRCKHTHTHAQSRLSQLTCRLGVHGSVTGRIVVAQWLIGPRPSRVTSSPLFRSLSLPLALLCFYHN